MLLLVICQASNIILHSTQCCLHVFLCFFGSFSCAPGFFVALCKFCKHLTFKIFLRIFFRLSGLFFDEPDYLHDCNWVQSSSPLSVGQLWLALFRRCSCGNREVRFSGQSFDGFTGTAARIALCSLHYIRLILFLDYKLIWYFGKFLSFYKDCKSFI